MADSRTGEGNIQVTLSPRAAPPAPRGAAGIYSTSGTPRHPARARTLPFCSPHRHAVTPQYLLQKSFPTAEISSPTRPESPPPGAVAAPPAAIPPARLRVCGSVSSNQRRSAEPPRVTNELSLHPGKTSAPRSRAANSCVNSPAGAFFSSSPAGSGRVVRSSDYYGLFLSTVIPHPAARYGDSFQRPAFWSLPYEEKNRGRATLPWGDGGGSARPHLRRPPLSLVARSPSKPVPPGEACLPWANFPRDDVPADLSCPTVPSTSPQPRQLSAT
ncbi:nascent polypeptide-associated complex subunit alpha, muscle-specific form-like [Phoca vitulina]|uniref:nascent polypeptide-associated complex subunit alpha, muscle-specific form-like n=1 Tax=Phoca vitulina TaxID=9720 RepID=UPI001395F149|nr:nascent polypeptide-associated complex subunit alpha, muscle-specific form-like [Phoca vitulina]